MQSCTAVNFRIESLFMKKTNNNGKYRNNNNGYNPNYSLSYRFDSNSPAGKIAGTALELIKKYNDLAKDAYSSGDYITSEIFRQYAEHYRKIVTDINERRNYVHQSRRDHHQNTSDDNLDVQAGPETPVAEAEPASEPQEKKEFKVIEINEAQEASRPKRTYRRKEAEAAAL